MYAAHHGHGQVVKQLLNAGANPRTEATNSWHKGKRAKDLAATPR